MAFREVTMLEFKEVLRLWFAQESISAIARKASVDRKTVRRYLAAAREAGISPSQEAISDEQLCAVIAAVKAAPEHSRGEAWERCEAERGFIAGCLEQQVRLSKVRRLLARRAVEVPYATLHRFAVAELGFGRRAPSVPVADCEPGEELQVDTGWMGLLEPDLFGKRHRFRA